MIGAQISALSPLSYSFTGHVNGSVANTHSGLNQVLTTGGLAVDHNSLGDTIQLPTPGSPQGSSTEYTYNNENRLTMVEGGISLTYDPLGRLYQVTTPTSTRRFAYDGLNVVGEYDQLGTYLHRYVHGAGVDEPVAWDDRSLYPVLTRRYPHADERGSVIAYSDNSDNVTHVNRYDEYGRPQDGALAGRFGYTGQLWLPEIGMYYYRARIYHPGLGRFMQPDPIGYESGMNLYAYVLNDPVNLVDPLGLDVGQEMDDIFCVGWNFCGPSGSFFGGAFDNPGVLVIGDRCRVIVCDPPEDPWWRQDVRLWQQQQTQRGPRARREAARNENQQDCTAGPVNFRVWQANVIGVLGFTFGRGTFTTASGGFGTFIVVGLGAGVDLGGSTETGRAPSLSSFAGMTDTLSLGIGPISATVSFSLTDGSVSSSSVGVGIGPPGIPASLSGQLTQVKITSFRCGSGR